LAGSGGDGADTLKHISSLYGEEGDGEWEVDNKMDWLALNPQGHGVFYIPESCMTEEIWKVFRTLPNNPIN